MSRSLVLGVALLVTALVGSSSLTLDARQTRTANQPRALPLISRELANADGRAHGWLPVSFGALRAPRTAIRLSAKPYNEYKILVKSRIAVQGVYTDAQSRRGREIYDERCAPCHGPALQGQLAPPLSGDGFITIWGSQPLSELVNKIQSTMPADNPGALTKQQSTDVVAYILQAGKFVAGTTELPADDAVLKQIVLAPAAAAPAATMTPAASHTSYPPVANLGQLMRGILFPSSNLIFNVQGHDPGAQKTGPAYQPPVATAFSWVDWGAGIYSGWELVDYAAVSIADAAPLLLVPGRRCENGRPVPMERADWVQYTNELVEAGRAAYKASQSRNRDAVIEVSNQLADACLHCHEVYRDKPGGTAADPSNKAARCVP